ncbi:MAG: hypothetical protein J5I93_15015 [Pirellulaceae bacterium]|nr:hypothetical protein [Pirellulaceae bacterium]
MNLHRRRLILWGASLAVAGALGLLLAAAWSLCLPPPEHASRPQLLRWLVQRDLQRQSDQVRTALVDRWQQELEAGLELPATTRPLPPALRHRLAHNCQILQRHWFLLRARQYASLLATERLQFLDRQVRALIVWTSAQQQLAASEPPTAGSAAADGSASAGSSSQVLEQLSEWVRQADPQSRDELNRAISDGFICWLSQDDLSQYPRAFRQDLAERIARSLDSGASGQGLLSALEAPRRERLRDNCGLLMEAWLHNRLAEYELLAARDRQSYVDRQLDRLATWDLVQVIGPDGTKTGRPAPPAAKWLELARWVEQWLARADPLQRPALQDMVAHWQQRLLWRQLQVLLPRRNPRD